MRLVHSPTAVAAIVLRNPPSIKQSVRQATESFKIEVR